MATSTCSICLVDITTTQLTVKNTLAFKGKDSLNTKATSVIQVKCKHVFHEGCLAKWIAIHSKKTSPPTCPNCRVHLMKDGGVRVTPQLAAVVHIARAQLL